MFHLLFRERLRQTEAPRGRRRLHRHLRLLCGRRRLMQIISPQGHRVTEKTLAISALRISPCLRDSVVKSFGSTPSSAW
jgi:hypothetical protein